MQVQVMGMELFMHMLYIIQLYVNSSCVALVDNWKRILNHIDCDSRKGICNYCLAVKHLQSSNFC
jgi:hypothetical protein